MDCSGWTITQLLQGFRDRSAPRAMIVGELTGLIAGSDETERQIINTAIEAMKLHQASETEPSEKSSSSETTGVLQLLWAYAGQIVERSLSSVTAWQSSGESDSSAAAAARLSAKQKPSTTVGAFLERVHVFSSLCHALGYANCLLLARFFNKVVYDPLNRQGHPWELVQALVSVYLEDIDNSETLTLSNIFERGGQDTRLANARSRIFRKPSGKGGEESGGEQPKWNNRSTDSATSFCVSFNLGRPHPPKQLHADGTCKHKHRCDHWVSGKGPGGRCEGKHPRSRCDNPDKVDKAEP